MKRARRRWWLLPVLYVLGVYGVTALAPPPAAVSLSGMPRPVSSVEFVSDLSWVAENGERELSQAVFDRVIDMIGNAREVILLDMFLFNEWQGPVRENHRALAGELTSALVAQQDAHPELTITLISDPINEVYGGLVSPHFQKLRDAGIDVILTDLTKLQDSNPLYSGLWRWLIRPFGNSPGDALPNPFGDGRVSVRSYLTLLNFKANHRKLLVADDGAGELHGLVMSANPHDGSSAHRNVALAFSGEAVLDLVRAEQALLSMNNRSDALQDWPRKWRDVSMAARLELSDSTTWDGPTLQVVNERRIKDTVLRALAGANRGDRVDLLMFYLSDRDIVTALMDAHARGAAVRVLLDVNQDAFGRTKNGVPNRPVAAELTAAGVPVRWCSTLGEQCHAKLLYWTDDEQHHVLLGSGNFTRRNLDSFNLESDVVLTGPAELGALRAASEEFEDQWNNRQDREYSLPYDAFADESLLLTLQYRVMEAVGISTF